jgi:hypothetical protein
MPSGGSTAGVTNTGKPESGGWSVFAALAGPGVGPALLWSLVCIVLLVLREPGSVLHPQLWAEDGPVFFLGSRQGLAAWFEPYRGYYHLLPRIIATVASYVDPAYVPHVYVYGALLVTALVIGRIFSSRLEISGRVFMALAVVLVPHLGEVFFTPTNIQWIAALALVVTVWMRDPESQADWVADIATVVLAGLSGPFSVFAAPVFLWRALRRRSRPSWILCAVVSAIAALQAWQLQLDAPAVNADARAVPFALWNALQVFSARVPLGLFGAQTWISHLSRTQTALAGIGLLLGVLWLITQRDRRAEARWMLVLFGAILLAVTFWKIRPDTWDYRAIFHADRYFYLPKVLGVWLLALTATTADLRGRVACAALAGVLIASLAVFRLPAKPRDKWQQNVPALRAGEWVEMEINPSFKFVVPPHRRGWRGAR